MKSILKFRVHLPLVVKNGSFLRSNQAIFSFKYQK